MLTQVNTNTVAMAYDLILFKNFHLQMEGWEEMSLILELI